MNVILVFVTSVIVQAISYLGYLGVGLLMAMQTVAIPIPSEIILPFAGYLSFLGRFNIFVVALVGALGSCAGSLVAYFIGCKGGRPLVEKYGRLILISRHDLEVADNFFIKYGHGAVFFGMMLPVFRSFISFPAGISKLSIKKFLLSVFVGSFLWSLLLAFLGMKLGENWGSLREKFKGLDYVIVVAILAAAGWWIYRHFRNREQVVSSK